MPCGTSFFNRTLYHKTISRFAPIWVAGLVLWILLLPVRGLLAMSLGGGAMERFVTVQMAGLGSGVWPVIMGACFGLVTAMAVCSHLYTPRSANFMGALPVRREGQFISHYLAGLTMLLAPQLLAFLLTVLVEGTAGRMEPAPLLLWLAVNAGCVFFFYTFAVLIGMITGHVLALPVFYLVFNFLATAALTLAQWTLSLFYYGFAALPDWVWTVANWLTPTGRLANLGVGYTHEDGQYILRHLNAWENLVIYVAVGVVMAVAALLLYRRRRLETAGDVVAVRGLRPLFKFGMAFASGLALGTLTTLMLNLEKPGLMISVVLWGLAGCYVAQMFLDKSFRVFKKWKSPLGVAVALAALFLVLNLDLTGYVSRVPRPEQVTAVQVEGLHAEPYDSASYADATLTQPEQILLVTRLHQALVEAHAQADDGVPAGDVTFVTITYTLENGSRLVRHYSGIPLYQKDLTVPGTVTYQAQALVQDRDRLWQEYGFPDVERLEQEGGRLYSADCFGNSYDASADLQALYEAVKLDFAQGNLGAHTFFYSGEDALYLYLYWDVPSGQEEGSQWVRTSIEVTLTPAAVHTLAVLEGLITVEGTPGNFGGDAPLLD